MSSFFYSTAKLEHRTPLPSNTTFEKAIALLRNHDFLIRLDPEIVSFKENRPPPGADVATKFYTITDHMNALPKGLWDTTVKFDAEMTDVETGIKWVIKAPLGLLQTSDWTIEQVAPEDGVGEEKGKGLVLVERVVISANRLLVSTVKNKCLDNYQKIHKKVADRLAETGEPAIVAAQELIAV